MRGPATNTGLTWERINPCLLDRLLGADGVLPVGGATVVTQPFASLRSYAESVGRDLDWLVQARAPLGTVELIEGYEFSMGGVGLSHEPARRLEQFPETCSSVLCFGVPDLTGRLHILDREIEGLLVKAVEDFEPRLDPQSVHIQRVARKGGARALRERGVGRRRDEGEDGDVQDSLPGKQGPSSEGDAGRRMFAIVAELWAQPRMERVDYVAEFDAVTGPRVSAG